MKTRAISRTNLRMVGVGRLAAMLTLGLTCSLAPNTVQAQTCHTVLQGHFDWAFNEPDGPGNYYLDFAMVSNQDGLNAAFAEGSLKAKITMLGSIFVGAGTQYSSKKRWNFSNDPEDLFNNPDKYPFNPTQAESVKVVLNATMSRATLYLANATYGFDLNCDHPGVLYGVGNAQGPWNLATPMFVISLKRGGGASPDPR
jgi:hypothetical protein